MKTTRFMSAVRNNKGFTMIEMMIVIILIGIVISFLFSYAGNVFVGASTQAASSKIVDDMRAINDAATRFQMENAKNATGLSTVAGVGLTTTLSQSGSYFLTSVPTPPATGTTETTSIYTWDATNHWGTTAVDASITLPNITSATLCKEINRAFAGSAATTAPSATLDITKTTQCYGTGTAYTAIMPIYIN